jgi:hypothetical protein
MPNRVRQGGPDEVQSGPPRGSRSAEVRGLSAFGVPDSKDAKQPAYSAGADQTSVINAIFCLSSALAPDFGMNLSSVRIEYAHGDGVRRSVYFADKRNGPNSGSGVGDQFANQGLRTVEILDPILQLNDPRAGAFASPCCSSGKPDFWPSASSGCVRSNTDCQRASTRSPPDQARTPWRTRARLRPRSPG